MDSNSEEELREELEATQRRLYQEQLAREDEKWKADHKASVREHKAAENTAKIVFFGGIALAFLIVLFE